MDERLNLRELDYLIKLVRGRRDALDPGLWRNRLTFLIDRLTLVRAQERARMAQPTEAEVRRMMDEPY